MESMYEFTSSKGKGKITHKYFFPGAKEQLIIRIDKHRESWCYVRAERIFGDDEGVSFGCGSL